jgi:hypothetical protein
MKRTLSLLFLLALCISVFACKSNSETSAVDIDYGSSTRFSNAEIKMATEAVLTKFKDFVGCELKHLWYDEEQSNRRIGEYWKYIDGVVLEENVIILISDFYVDSSGKNPTLNPDSTYTDWMWILTRESKGDKWTVDDWGC